MEETPHAVLCHEHGQQFLTDEQYNAQMMAADSLWICPVCGKNASWDDDHYEAYQNKQEEETEKRIEQTMLEFNKDEAKRFKRIYHNSRKFEGDIFIYKGHEIYKGYAKYLVEHLENTYGVLE